MDTKKTTKKRAPQYRFQTDDELADDLKDALVEFKPSLNVFSSSGDGRTEVRLTVNRKRVRK
jgi:hypothetical protein